MCVYIYVYIYTGLGKGKGVRLHAEPVDGGEEQRLDGLPQLHQELIRIAHTEEG